MGVPVRHIVHQRRVLAALGRTLAMTVKSRFRPTGSAPPVTPGPDLRGTSPALPADLIADSVRWAGGRLDDWGGSVPSWLHPQWGFPLLMRTLDGLPYPLGRALNAGCRLTLHGPIPQGEPLKVRVRLDNIDDDGRRAILHQKLFTGTASAPDALEIDFQVLVPLPRKKGEGGSRKKKEPALVPSEAQELARWTNGSGDGLDFALLTGDFNPIHWIPPAAKLSGFPNTILHGFGTMARAMERLIEHRLDGQPERLATVGVRFTKPVVLPREVGLFVTDEGGLYVGDAPGKAAYLVGDYTVRSSEEEDNNDG